MTDVVRSDPPHASLAAFFSVLGVVVLLALFTILTILGFLLGHDQLYISIWMGIIFFLLAVLIDLYRREYLPDEMIHKKRRPKIVDRRPIR